MGLQQTQEHSAEETSEEIDVVKVLNSLYTVHA